MTPGKGSSTLPPQLLRAIDTLADTVLLADADGVVVYANQSMLKRSGYAQDQLIGQPMTAFWIQPNAQTQFILAELAANRTWRGRIQHKADSGGFFEEAVAISPVVDENGAVTHLIKTGRLIENADDCAEGSGQIDTTFQSILGLMGDGYIETDLRGNTTFLNISAARIYQRSPEEMIGLNYKAYMTPAEAERIYQIFNEIYRTGRSGRIIDFEVVGKDGTHVSCETITTLLHDHQGHPVGFGGVIRDVTEKKQLATQLKESEESYRRVMELAPDAITISRVSDGRYYEVNEAFCQQTGYARHEVIGRTVLDLNLYVDPEDRKRIVHALRTDGRLSGMRVNFRHRDGSLLCDIVSARIIRFKGQDCILFVATLINSLVEAQNALKESEHKYRMIMNAAPDIICLTRLEDGRYIEANDMFYLLTGHTPADTIGRTARDLGIYADPEDRGRFTAALQEKGRVDGMEILTRFKDGSLSAQLWSGRVVEYNGEKCLLVVTKSIDDLKKAQQLLHEREESYRAIFETAADAIFVNDLEDGRFLDVNQAACQHLGYSMDRLERMHLKDVIQDQNPYKVSPVSMDGRRPERVFFESVHIRSDGKQIPVEVSSGMVMRSGRPALLSIVRDVNERKQAEAELAKYRQHLEEIVHERTRALEEAQNELIKQEKLAVLGQLTATVSHDLRNPLGVIRSSNFYVMKKISGKDEKIDKHIRRIEEQVSLCDTIVADLLEFTRGRQIAPAKQSIQPWAEQVVSQMRESENFDITVDIPSDLPWVPHDQEKMRRVVVNLLDNAIQAVRARQAATQNLNESYQPLVILRAARHDRGLLLQVSDNGCGMNETTRRRAFEPLFTTRARGTGIGLANVSKIVSEHGGRIELESEENQGTTMTILLPYETDQPIKKVESPCRPKGPINPSAP
jgi:PAS domain S-box-containing protein